MKPVTVVIVTIAFVLLYIAASRFDKSRKQKKSDQMGK